MPRIVRSIQSYQKNLNSPLYKNPLEKDQKEIGTESQRFYNLGVKTFTNNTLGMVRSYPPRPNYVEEPSQLRMQSTITDDISKYHMKPQYGASKYTSTLQSGKMHKLIHNNL